MKQDNKKPEPNILAEIGMEVLGFTIKAVTLTVMVIVGLAVLMTGGHRE